MPRTNETYGTERHSMREPFRGRTDDLGTQEGVTTRKVERITSAFPSLIWMTLAGASIVGSLVYRFTGRHHDSIFIGQWAPMFMLIGVYNKLVKVGGSDRSAIATAS